MRQANLNDIPEIIAMFQKFHAAEKPPYDYDMESTMNLFTTLINDHFVAIGNKGFIAGVLQPLSFNPAWLIASEFLWWSEGGDGMKLLTAFRKWAKERGANEIRLSCNPSNKRVCRAYERHAASNEIIYSEVI